MNISKDVLVFIFDFLPLLEIRHSYRFVSEVWCKAALHAENKIWQKHGRTFIFDNCVYDAVTGEKIYDFAKISTPSLANQDNIEDNSGLSERREFKVPPLNTSLASPSSLTKESALTTPASTTELSEREGSLFHILPQQQLYGPNDGTTLFESLFEEKHIFVYTHVPYQYQQLSGAQATNSFFEKLLERTANTGPTPPSPVSATQTPISRSGSETATSAVHSMTLGTVPTLGTLPSTNGNASPSQNVVVDSSAKYSCYSFPIAAADYRNLAFTHTNYTYMFHHDGRYMYVLFGNNVVSFDLLLNKVRWKNQIDSKNPKFMYVNFYLQNNNYVYVGLPQELIAFAKETGERTSLIPDVFMNKKKERIKDVIVDNTMVVAMYGDIILVNNNLSKEPEPLATPREPYSKNALRKKTLEGVPLDPPKFFIFDGNNNYITSAVGQAKDKHIIIKPPKAPVFCLISNQEIRVVTKDGKRIHVINYNKDLQFEENGGRYFMQGKYGTEEWYMMHPESGRVISLAYLGQQDRVFVVENPHTSHLQGLLTMDTKTLCYWEQVEEKAIPEQESKVQTSQVLPPASPSTSSTTLQSSLIVRKMEKRWSVPFKWKDGYYKFKKKTCRLYTSPDGKYFVITRPVIDNRRFLSAAYRLDIHVAVYEQSTGKPCWERIHECYFNAKEGEEVEKGFDLILEGNQVIAMSYIILMGRNDGLTSFSSYGLQNGQIHYTKMTKRKKEIGQFLEQHLRASAKKRLFKVKERTVEDGSSPSKKKAQDTTTPQGTPESKKGSKKKKPSSTTPSKHDKKNCKLQ